MVAFNLLNSLNIGRCRRDIGVASTMYRGVATGFTGLLEEKTSNKQGVKKIDDGGGVLHISSYFFTVITWPKMNSAMTLKDYQKLKDELC